MTKPLQWSTACPDWQRRIVEREPLCITPTLYPRAAADALRMFDALRLLDVPGSPTLREAAPPWVRDWARVLFGSLDPRTGRRRIWEHFVLVAKKNGKSTFAGALILVEFLRCYRRSADFAVVSPTREASENAFQAIRDMVRSDDDLAAMVHVRDHIKALEHRTTGARLKVFAADSETVAGKRLSGLLVDELWAFGRQRNAEAMLRELIGARAARPEFFVIYASTQSDEPPSGVFRSKLHYARRVRDGDVIDPQFLPLLYEYPADMLEVGEHLDPARFYICNPSVGVTVDPQFLADELRKSQEQGDEAFAAFCAKHLNLEAGATMLADRWRAATLWPRAADRSVTLEALLARCDSIVAGIDAGGHADFTALALIGRDRESGKLLLWAHAWVQASALDYYKAEATRWRAFESDGDLTIYETAGDDLAELDALLERLGERVALVAVDRHAIDQIVKLLERHNFEATEGAARPILAVPQGSAMHRHVLGFERALSAGELLHGGQPMLDWMMSNVRLEARGNAVMLSKALSGRGKIDGVIAAVMAYAALERAPAPRAYQVFFV